ncbi:MAG TPA: SDR family NAD(P)-dependent oxidoreductase [Bradyrhizobium sp.]|nr:SDR family NAD(P)-dependent oxidoreductase [Bradyrhizobium sp.]
MKLSGNTILITGGGSGIGRELAREFHQAGNNVIIVGRRQDVLDEVVAAHPGMIARRLDMHDGPAIAEFAAQVTADHPGLNVVVNNAGIMIGEDKIELLIAEEIISINLLGPIRLTSALLRHLMAQPQSAIVNVSSALAFVPLVFAPTYCATKAALHSWSVSIRGQLRNTSVEVIELIPPGVQTDLLPGHSQNPRAMPLHAFMAETIAQLRRQPTPEEICGEWADSLRSVVNPGLYRQMLRSLNEWGDS